MIQNKLFFFSGGYQTRNWKKSFPTKKVFPTQGTFFLPRILEYQDQEKKKKRKVFQNQESEVFPTPGTFFLLRILEYPDQEKKRSFSNFAKPPSGSAGRPDFQQTPGGIFSTGMKTVSEAALAPGKKSAQERRLSPRPRWRREKNGTGMKTIYEAALAPGKIGTGTKTISEAALAPEF